MASVIRGTAPPAVRGFQSPVHMDLTGLAFFLKYKLNLSLEESQKLRLKEEFQFQLLPHFEQVKPIL